MARIRQKSTPNNFIYKDNMYMTFDLTKADQENLMKALRDGALYVRLVNDCIVGLEGLRFVTPANAANQSDDEEENVFSSKDHGTPIEYVLEEFVYEKGGYVNPGDDG